jgi:hypothetical protein
MPGARARAIRRSVHARSNFLTQRIGTLLMTIETRAQRLAVDALTRGAA